MKKKPLRSKLHLFSSVALTLVSPLLIAGSAQAKSARPPQYIALAFDGSKSLPMWQETQKFADELTKQGKPVRFTYFINSVYYLNNSMRNKYNAPQGGPGKSAIGFGGTVNDVLKRYDQTNYAFKRGHEIANHAAGHFDGSTWTELDWKDEFSQFYDMIFDIFKFNETKPTQTFPTGWIFGEKDVSGFRAPQLGQNKAMYTTLPAFGIKYDTSKTAPPSAWPNRNKEGTWNFPLAEILVAGTAKKTLSMDYNFYYVQSKAVEDPDNAAQYEEQMYQSYINYFKGNYSGNRAPINIGHHFSKWNNGAYWNAMRRFAATVCGLPEVKCVAYRDLMEFMEGINETTLQAYRTGDFDKAAPVQLAPTEPSYDIKLHLATDENGKFEISLEGKNAAWIAQSSEAETIYSINDQRVTKDEMNIVNIRNHTARGATATIHAAVMKSGREIQTLTYKIYDVGTAQEKLSSTPEENSFLIADPPEAHDE